MLFTLVALAVIPVPASAVELPPAGNAFWIQTNGPNSAITLGDWYTSGVAGGGGGYHYVQFQVPCGWPAATSISVDLFSPEMNRVAGALAQHEEPNGNYDSTQFELYGPGATVGPGFGNPAPGTGIAGTQTTYQPGAAGVAEAWARYATLAAPVTCGSYVLRSQVLTTDPMNPGGTGDDQNGWRLRVGTDNDANPNNVSPANYDNPDGIAGTNDELTIGMAQVSFQQSSGAVACQTFYEYTTPGQASATFNNFDMDGNTRLRYYAPGDPAYDPNANAGGTVGTMSGDGIWNNGGTLATRVGDTIANPTTGWWRVVNCLSNNNQLIQEGQQGVLSYYTQPPTPNMTLTKTDGVAVAAPGQALTYTITATNNSPAATGGAANNVVVTDTIPAGFTYTGCSIPTPAQGTWTCSQAAGVVTFTQTGWINRGAAASLRVTGTVNQGVTGSITNTARVNYRDAIGNVFPQVTATDVDTITASSNLSIAKTDSTDPENPGQSFNYVLTVNNAGPSNATNVVVSDTIPSQYTVNTVTSPTGTCGNVGNAVTCTLAAYASGAAAWVITINVTVKATTVGGTYVNTATVGATEADPAPANNTVNNNNTVRATGDLAVTKTDGVAAVTVGSSTTYTITVTNNGPDIEPAGVVISDTIPAGTTGSESEADCAIIAGVFRCTTVATIPVGASRSYQLTLTLPAGYAAATLVNTAAVTTFPITDTVAANNSATDSDTVAQANLSITKADSVDPVSPGASFTYTLTVNNAGPATATSLVVSDTVPSQYTVNTVTSPAGTCGNVGNVVTCTRPSMASGAAAWVITVNVTVKTTTPGGTYVNIATVSSATNDPTPANNTANNNNTVRAFGDLVLTKSDGTTTVTAGTSTTYTITITNNGPSTEPVGVRFTDTIPAGTVGSETEADCAIAAGVFTCTTTATIAAGASRSYGLTLAVPSGYAPATVVNTANITVRPITDPDLTNNSATDTDTVVRSADLSITKTDSIDPVVPSQAFTYTLTVTNNGPSDAATLTVSDTVPAQFTVTNVTAPTGACGHAGNVVTCTRPTFVNAATWVITVFVTTIAAAPGGTFTNTATVSAVTTDPVAANNSASQDTTISASADLAITKTDGVASVAAGSSTTYTITVTNNGPSDEPAGAVISDTIPAGTTGSESEADCTIAAGTFACTTSAVIAPGASVAYQLTLAVAASFAPANLSNTATITSTPVTDPNGANDASTDTDNVTRSADLSIAKVDSADPVAPGQAFTYTLTVMNNGPADAATLSVSDTVPPQFTVTNVTSPAGTCGHAGNVVTCTRPALASAATWVITVAVTTNLGAPPGTYTDTATVSASTTDPVPGNDSSSQDTTIVPSADLSIVKTDSADPVSSGDALNYVITVTNNGPSPALTLSVTDSIPAPGSFSITSVVPSAGTCGNAGNDVTCSLGLLTSGSTWTITVSVLLDPLTSGGLYTDTADVTSATFDPNLSNNAESEDTVVLPAADLAIDKDDGVTSVVAGTSTTYTITLTNNGPSAELAGVVVSDPIPAGTTGSESEADCAIAAGTFTCTTSASIAPFGSVSYQLTLNVPPGYGSPTLANTATITSTPVTETDPTNDSDTDTDTVVAQGDLGITKTDGVVSVTAGTSTTYTITATNAGPSTVPAGVVISDPIPAGTVGSESEADCSIAVGTFTCTTSGAIAVGGSVSYQLTLAVVPGYAPATLANTASVTSSPAVDSNPANDSATDTDTVTTSADLAMSKDDGVVVVVAGTSTTYTITVTNNGPSAEPAGVVLSDPIPAGTVGSESEADCAIAAGTFTCTTSAVIAPGGSLTYQLTVVVPPGSPIVAIVNTVSIAFTPITDPDASNDAATDTDTVTRSADLAIAKTDGVVAVIAGTSTTYTITLTNTGPSTEPAGVVLSDPIPAGTTPTESEPDCVIVAGTFTCTTTAPLAPGASASYLLTLAVPPNSPLALLVNTVSLTSTPIADPNGANDSATDTDAVGTSADLSVVKTDSADPISPGNALDYVITVTNAGPSDALNLQVTDTIPASGSFVITNIAAGPGACGSVGSSVTCTLGALPVTGTWVITISIVLDPATPGGLYTDTAHVTSTTPDPVPGNNDESETTSVLPAVDVVVTKTDGVASVAAGTSTTYTITLTNAGPSTELAGAVVSDPIPAGTSGSESEADCVIAAGTFTCTTSAPIAPGGSVSYQLMLAVPSGYAPATLVNTAAITFSPIADADPANDSATDTDTVTSSADLAITKTDLVDPVAAGADVTYMLSVTNAGPSDANGVVITDTLPGSVVFVSATPSQGSCSQAAGVVTCPVGIVTVGATVVVTIVATTTIDGVITDTAAVTASTTDSVPGNDTDSEDTTVTPAADLGITKTDGVATIAAGTSTTYTITLTNHGPSVVAPGVLITDPVPAGTLGSESEPDCSIAAGVFTCSTSVSLGSGASVSYQLTIAVPSSYVPLSVTNTATLASSPIPDPNASNDSATDVDAIGASADLAITKTDSPDPVVLGNTVTYTITVTNNGPSDAAGVVVTDTLPGSANFVSAVPSQGSCSQAAGVVTCPLGGLVLGAVATITVVVGTTVAAVMTNQASVTATTPDPVPGNDDAVQNTTVLASSDLAIAKTDGIAAVSRGTSTTYTITLANNGPSIQPAGVVISDPIPAGTTGSESEADCTIVAGVFSCVTSAPLGNGTSISYQLTLAIPAGYVPATLSNTASITSSPVVDPNGANNSATDVDTLGASADLAITKTDNVTSVRPGSSTTFTITLTNNGPSDVPAGIVVTDQVPAGTTATETEADCVLSVTTFTCTTTTVLVSGGSIVYHLTLAIPATYVPLTLVNTATITTSPVPDPNPANDTATDTDAVTPIAADLSIAKTDSADPVMPGDTFSYTIAVTNAGPDDARNLVLNDTVPAPLVVDSVASTGAGVCVAASNAVTCALDPLAATAVWTVTIQVSVPADAAPGTVTNTATVSGTGDTDLTNDSASQDTTIGGSEASLTLTKTVDNASPAEGDVVTYTVSVTNEGPADATGVEVTDDLPNGLTFLSASPSQGSYHQDTGIWNVGALAAGLTADLQIRARIDQGTAGTTITNGARVSGADQADPTPGDDAATAPVEVEGAGGGGGGGGQAPGGGTSFTGFPGPGLFAWMFGLAILGLIALAFGGRRRRTVLVEPQGPAGVAEPPQQGRRFLDGPDAFFFGRDE